MSSTLKYLQAKDDGSKDDKDSEDSEDEDSEGATQGDGEQFCTCSTSLNRVFRDDLPDDVRVLFINTIGATMEQVCNYTSEFSKQVLKVALLFAKNTSKPIHDGGNSIASILPEGNLEEDIPVPKPLDASCLENEEFNAHYQLLSLESHLEQIQYTRYIMVKGGEIEESTLKSHLSTKQFVMKMARQQYYTNLRVWWSQNTIVNKRKLFSDVKKRKAKYEEKEKQEAVDMCQMRINTHEKHVERHRHRTTTTAVAAEAKKATLMIEKNTNASRKRISQFVNIERSALFATQDITNAHLQDQDEQITTQKSATIIKITSFIRPYIPSSETYHLLSCQLKFIFMANQVLRSIGYEGRAAKFIPIVRPTTLHALLIDTTTLYALFCSSKLSKRMHLRDFQGNYLRAMKDQKKKHDKSLRDHTNELLHFLQDNGSVRGLKEAWRTKFEEQKQYSKQTNQDNILATFTNLLARKKKTTGNGYRVLEMGKGLGKNNLYQCSTADGLEQAHSHHTNAHASLHSLYYNQSMTKRRRRLEHSYRKGSDRLAAYEKRSPGVKSRLCLSVIVDTDSALASRDTDDLVGPGNSSSMAVIHQH
ncbi:hypothetical protein BD408DRAFT_435499 [Parasitella parasitica]|nr:hypothetical protein BD408DRAFT_435499 [Parasitella parasitica]